MTFRRIQNQGGESEEAKEMEEVLQRVLPYVDGVCFQSLPTELRKGPEKLKANVLLIMWRPRTKIFVWPAFLVSELSDSGLLSRTDVITNITFNGQVVITTVTHGFDSFISCLIWRMGKDASHLLVWCFGFTAEQNTAMCNK